MDDSTWAVFTPQARPMVAVGREVRFFQSIGSTNDALKDAARAGAAEGLVYVTDEQVAGRGRRGRTWAAPAGTSLLTSILLRPTWLSPTDAFLLTILAAVAAAEALETAGVKIDLKWPNDLQIAGRKLGGILVETELSDNSVQWAVLGCGINVNWNPGEVPEIAATATSLMVELGEPLSRRNLLQTLLMRLDARYTALRHGARSALFNDWRSRLHTLGQHIRAETPQGVLLGVAEDVTPDGSLVIRDDRGIAHVVTAGDVTVRPST